MPHFIPKNSRIAGLFIVGPVGFLALLCLQTAPAATITVTGTGDTITVNASVTLREAITSINNGSNVNADVVAVGAYGTNDAIFFNIPGAGVKTINVTSALPTLAKPLLINGYTQTGATSNTLANADNAVILIELNGAGAGAGTNGLTLGPGVFGSEIQGLTINRFSGNGIVIQSDNNAIYGNFVGVDPTGTIRMPNGTFPNSGDGILIQNASGNLIGETSPQSRNIVSGNALDGIHIVGSLIAPATGNRIQGNFVGVAADGTSSLGSQPIGITQGADGNLWFTGFSNNAIGRITPAGVVTKFSLGGLAAGSGPIDIVSDPANNLLYFSENNVGRIGSINPLAGSDALILASETQSAVVPSGAGAGVSGITLGPDGNLWFTEANASRVAWINPSLTTIKEFSGLTAGAAPANIVTGADGALWFTEFSNNAMGRITTAGTLTEFSLAALGAGSGPFDIVSDPANNLLYFSEKTVGKIGRINPLAGSNALILASETQSAVVPSGAGAGVSGITLGPDGNLWFTEANASRVANINPTLITINEFGSGITAGAAPVDIVTGPDGGLWFTEFGKNAVGRITTVGVVTNEFSLRTAFAGGQGNNLFGIEISGGNNNTVGGTTAGARNVVGFNGDGIDIDNGGQGNTIQGNFSGVGADGVTAAGNNAHGIVLSSSNGLGSPFLPAQSNEPGVSFNLIGGTAAGVGNLVEFNGTSGIAIFGNPVSASGQPNIGNAIEGNSVFENGRANSTPAPLGIDLTNQFLYPKDDGGTPNDSKGHDAPNDPNNFQNFPVLTAATSTGSMTNIAGTLSSAPNSTFRIEFFANDPDPLSLPAEGQQFLGFITGTTDANGNVSFSNASFNGAVANGRSVTATAIDSIGNTSEFSAGVVVPTQAPSPTPTPTATPTPTPTVAPTKALDLATRARVDLGDKVTIGGFIITGNAAKKVVVRGLGPSLTRFNLSGVLLDPVLELRQSNGSLIFKNDNWKDDQRAQIEGGIFQPTDDRESVIFATLAPGAYTATLSGKLQTTGIGEVEVYDNDQEADSQLANISTRGFVQTGDNVMIGGFQLGGGTGNLQIAVRGIGPSLSQFGLSNLLANPVLELRDSNGAVLIANDDWQSNPVSAGNLTAKGLGLQDPKESGIFTSLPPGAFTAILTGANGGTGIGLVEIYNVP